MHHDLEFAYNEKLVAFKTHNRRFHNTQMKGEVVYPCRSQPGAKDELWLRSPA